MSAYVVRDECGAAVQNLRCLGTQGEMCGKRPHTAVTVNKNTISSHVLWTHGHMSIHHLIHFVSKAMHKWLCSYTHARTPPPEHLSVAKSQLFAVRLLLASSSCGSAAWNKLWTPLALLIQIGYFCPPVRLQVYSRTHLPARRFWVGVSDSHSVVAEA